MKSFLRVLSSLIITGSTGAAFIPSNQNIKLEKSLNTAGEIKKIGNQDMILGEFSKGGGGMIGHDATESEISRFSNLVPYYQFFTKLRTDKSMGYAEGSSGQGLCEYISLGTLLLYDELFVSSGYFTDAEFNMYFDNPKVTSGKIAIPEHISFYGNSAENSFARKLWEKNSYATDIKTGGTLARAFRNWVANKDINSKIKDEYSASWMHSSSPENLLLKYNVPVLVSFTSTGGHNVLIYGYDSASNSYLVHYGWSNHPSVIIKKSDIWSFWSMGFWNAFYLNGSGSANSVKKHFKYSNSNEFYTWKELEQKGLSFDDIAVT